MKKTIYIADDIEAMRLMARIFLEKAGYAVEEFPSGDLLLSAFIEKPADLVILDVMMPGPNGFVICKELRKISRVPIIMLTGRSSDLDYVTSRDLGSDDYLLKPVEPNQLIARVNALINRTEKEMDHETIPTFSDDEAAKLKDVMKTYGIVLENMLSQIHEFKAGLESAQMSNPIERFSGRLKTQESIAKKLKKMGAAITAESAQAHLTDIIGIRVISSFTNDIKAIAEHIKFMPGVELLKEKDYVNAPKPSGYRSHHVIISVPVCDGVNAPIPVEFQIRTGAMDFWASLEHKVRYKYNGHVPQHLLNELVICANKINELDERMFLIHDIISLINQKT
ncbi:MAG TPA: hypothetical protein DEB31_03845 [Clostridiales bacterium]|nr:hypothetical protein [Clostridiales bacterium]